MDAYNGFLFVVLFGSGSWVAVNGVFSVSVPLWIRTPECSHLASYLVVAIQMGNIGALAYYLAERCQRQKSHKKLQIGTILAIYVIGTVSCLLLAFLWDKTDYIAGGEHSVALLSLTVVLAMVDCTTSMTFLPYMNQFPHLIAALFVGEGLSGMIPSVLGLIQTQNVPSPNVSSMFCPNQTLGDLRFSIGEYFGLLVALMLLSFVGFLGLNLYPGMKKLRGKNQEAPLIHEDEGEGVECCETCMDHSEESEEVAIVQTTEEENPPSESSLPYLLYLLAVQGWINCLANGLLPAVSPYAFLPYGNEWSAAIFNIGTLSNPVTALLAYFFIPWKKMLHKRILKVLLSSLVILSTGLGAFIIWVASPMCDQDRPLYGKPGGALLMLFINVTITVLITFMKITIAKEVQRHWRERGLLRYGLATQIGSLVGALSIFAPIQVDLFKQPTCRT